MKKIQGYKAIQDKILKKGDMIHAIANQPPPPCAKFDCPRKDDCASQSLACDAFIHYVQTGSTIDPHLRKVMQFDEKNNFRETKEFRHHWAINATRKKYEKSMKDYETA